MPTEPNTLYVRCDYFPNSTKGDLIRFLDEAGLTYAFVCWMQGKNYAFVKFDTEFDMEHARDTINDALFSGQKIGAWR